MKHVRRSALVHHSARQMFDLVNDVESYPEFLPWCRATRVFEATDSHMRAQVEMAVGSLTRSFSTRNTLTPPERIELSLLHGPFRHLQGEWRFDALSEQACKVHLEVSFEVSNRLLSTVLTPAFEKICNSLVAAFTKRADRVYGRG
ncbi:MAG: type II toxin-antitoxin system RatA family toxin [Gammaproteobacteria bacterium]|nr:type II toxin-antitoxin system RatA family toxin [Gammaproteobacteria bacterium]TVQ43494.1 MAG: type II toxin-antitoxin system RatA family toxin [Gammaproteobacteria bacterium]